MDFRLGDIIEFRDFRWDKDKKVFISADQNWIGRIDSIYHNTGDLDESESEWELWCEYYSEVPSRLYVTPERVIRVIEQGGKSFPHGERPPIKLGVKVKIPEQGKLLYDEICGHEARFDDGELSWQYQMKHSKYLMDTDEFEVINA